MKITKKLEAEILKIYQTYWDAYLSGDMKTFASMLDDNIKVFGTAVSEVFNNKAETVRFYKATADQMTGKAEFRNRKIKMNSVDKTVLIHEQCDLFVLIENEWIFYGPVRVSALFVKTPKGWKLTHQHGSFPDNRAEAGEQIAPEKIKKENLELREAIKRRTVELENKNRELEIEASLEKVRTIAMGMREPADMLDVCKTISIQLQSLGVKEIRNVQTAIIYVSKSIYINFEYYAKHKKQFITEVDFKSHYYQKLFVNKMLKGTGEIFTKTIKGKKVKEWYEHQKTTNQFADRYLGKAKSLSYYWFSLGPIALGISTYSPLSEEELNLFIRFRNVFELAYRRYLDIEKAEAQAREAKIEASLERVRAVAMSMHKSDDLLSICEVAFNEFQKLGFNNLRNAVIHILNDEKRFFLDYNYSEYQGGSINSISYNSHPIVENYLIQIKKADDAFAEAVIKGQQLDSWKDFRRSSGQLDDPRLDKIPALYYYLYSIGVGDIGISTFKPIENDQLDILKRFRNVFNLSYQRYSDIAQAEAQASEAKIETSLERVRAVAMSMNKPDDLLNICEVMFKELQSLRFNKLRNTLISTYQDDKDYFDEYDYSDASGGYITKIPYSSHPALERFQKQIWRTTDAFEEFIIGEDQLNDWKEHRRSNGEPDDPRLENISALYYYFYSIGPASIGISTFDSISEEMREVLKRFRNVFSLSYQRYTDIALAEAQAREAQIETALERVRSRTMGMQKSEDLKYVVATIFEKLSGLNIEMNGGMSIATFIEDSKDLIHWVVNPALVEGAFEMHLNYFPSKVYDDFNDARDNDKEILCVVYNKEELTEYFGYAFKFTGFAIAPDDAKRWVLDQPSFGYTAAIRKHSAIFFNDYTGKFFSEEENAVLLRFSNVFEQAYVRFLDLQKAEAQAREAQIQASLERLRAKSMSMQQSDELHDVLAVLCEQFDILGILPMSTHMTILDIENNKFTFRETGKFGNRSFGEHTFALDAMDTWKDMVESWRNSEPFTINRLHFPKENLPQVWEVFYESFASMPEESRITPDDYPDGIYHTAGKHPFGYIGMNQVRPATAEEEQIVIKFANEFGRAYQRFLDLQKAEAQAREAKIEASMEKIRSRSLAMQKPGELVEVAELLRKEMGLLGVEELETSSIYIVDEENQKAECWYAIKDIREENKRLVSDEMTLTLSDTWVGNEMWKFYRSKEGQISIVMKGDNRKEWINDCADKSKVLQGYYGNEIPERTYHLVKFNGGYMGAASPGDISSESWDLLKRASAVFSLAYTRFKDLQDAEASAREAQIEAALERVRSRTMGMQKSEELKEVIRVVYEQFVHLKINVDHAGFVVDYTPKGDWHFWIADEQDIPSKITHPYFESVWANQFNEAKEKGANLFATNLNFEEKNKFYNKLLSHVHGLPKASKDFYLSCPGLAATTVLFDNVSLYIENFSGIPYTVEENNILMRFGKVFQQTYTRFLDLQKAEAQTREAQIESSLERVRSKAMSMHSPDDLSETVNVFFKELKRLGIIPIRCGVGQIDDETRTTSLTTTTSSQQGESFRVIGKVKQTGHPVLDGIFDHWKLQKEYHPVLEGEDIKAYYNVMNAQIGYPEYPEEVTQYGNNFFFTEGFVFAWTENLLSEEELIIFRRFTSVLSLTYRRYMDLREAEAQAKEAQIEAALERVRSRTMGMQKSDELAETVSVLFKQLLDLGIKSTQLRTCGIVTFKENEPKGEIWITDITGEIIRDSFIAPYDEAPAYKMIYSKWKKGKKFLEINLKGTAFIEHLNFVKRYSDVPNINLDEIQKMYSEIFIHVLFFSQGYLFIISYEPLPHYHDIFKRFGTLFQQTYTRFLDFKKVEAQNKIIQAENERKTKELEDARQLQLAMLPKELPHLPHLDIAVYMKTATEVGGDYYDFNVDSNGTLTVVLGDATGHGMMSGMMVSIMKSFFISNKANIELKQFFENANNSIKDMHLGRLMMSFMGVQITSNKVIATNAGMPSLIYFRNKSQKAGEFVSNNLPLGAMKGTKYLLKEIVYEKGDALLLMSDGFAELKNKNNEQYGYPRIIEEFRTVAHKDSDAIVEHLNNSASEWIIGVEPDDDVTIVVIKIRQ